MDFTKSLAYKRNRFKSIRSNQMKERKNRLDNHAKTLDLQHFERKEVPNGVTQEFHLSNGFSNFNNPVATSSITDTGLYNDDDSGRIRALRIKAQYQPLTQKEKDQIQHYYYMQDRQVDKDSRYILNEGYKLGKKLF